MFRGLAIILVASMITTGAQAQSNSNRAGSWEFGVLVTDNSSETLVGPEGATLDIDSEIGWGITAGYHVTDKLELMFDIMWSSPDYLATRIIEDTMLADTIQADLDMFTYQFKGVFHLIDGDFTPFVAANAGWTNMDSNIIDSPPTTGCWWDPWWGYICETFVSTYSKTRFSYGAEVGLRMDLQNGMAVKASYGIQEIDTSNATESASFDAWRMDILWRF